MNGGRVDPVAGESFKRGEAGLFLFFFIIIFIAGVPPRFHGCWRSINAAAPGIDEDEDEENEEEVRGRPLLKFPPLSKKRAQPPVYAIDQPHYASHRHPRAAGALRTAARALR